jgi:hypothetical protein
MLFQVCKHFILLAKCLCLHSLNLFSKSSLRIPSNYCESKISFQVLRKLSYSTIKIVQLIECCLLLETIHYNIVRSPINRTCISVDVLQKFSSDKNFIFALCLYSRTFFPSKFSCLLSHILYLWSISVIVSISEIISLIPEIISLILEKSTEFCLIFNFIFQKIRVF